MQKDVVNLPEYGINVSADVPTGNNKLNAVGGFVQREFYNKKFEKMKENANIRDFRNKGILYGRINSKNDIIEINTNKLIVAYEKEQKLYLVNFASDALKSFLDYCELYDKRFTYSKAASILKLKPTKAFVDSVELYHKYMAVVYEAFNTKYLSRANHKELLDFESFLKLYVDCAKIIATQRPLLKSTFMASKYCTMNINGLTVEFGEYHHSDDYAKSKSFWLQEEFEIWNEVAIMHGFYVDYNAPWRIVADIDSPAMQKYMNVRGTARDSVLDDYYHLAVEKELELIRKYLIGFYNTYVSSNPTVLVGNSLKKRKLLTDKDWGAILPIEELKRLFCLFRTNEENVVLDDQQFVDLFREFKDFDTAYGFIYASSWLNLMLQNLKETN